jgi:hypothetical protein
MKGRMFKLLFILHADCYLPSRVLAFDDCLEAARKEYAWHFFSVDAHVNLADGYVGELDGVVPMACGW